MLRCFQDGVFASNVFKLNEKPWVAQLLVPYIIFFGVACVVSVFTLVHKGKLLSDKFRRRHAAPSDAAGVSVESLEDKLGANKMEIRRLYCVLLLGATEGACALRLSNVSRCQLRLRGC